MGLEVFDAVRQLSHFRAGDIGRIGHNHIKFTQKRRSGTEGIRLNAGHPSGKPVRHHVLFCHGQRVLGDIRQCDPRILDPGSQRQTDAAGAGAQIQNPGIRR